ncbi:hypothetical protein H8356DRAFT_1640010 [Neocallimastix lanati (nom. inval.)]|nr:hypothetical protein H8356DRAFT_1640010 [Neocallimastix sp. JGI-2020a]
MKVHLKAWYLLTVNDKYKCNNFQEKNKWKIKNYIFSTWIKAYKKSKNQRELIQEAENYKNEQIKLIKAIKFWMQTTKSKCFVAWTIFSQVKKQEDQIKEQHKTRVKKMNEFLNREKKRLVEKQNQENELKMSQLIEIMNQEKDLSLNLLQTSNKNKSSFSTSLNKKEKENEKKNEVLSSLSLSSSPLKDKPSEETATISSTKSIEEATLTSLTKSISNEEALIKPTSNIKYNKKKNSLLTSSIRNFKSTKPRITKADKKFCEEMEKRNQQILERKRQSEQRRKEKEEKLKKQKEEEARKKEEEIQIELQRERQRRLEEKKKAKLEQIEKEKRREKFLSDNAKAKEHYNKVLILYYGLYPWKQYSWMIKKDNQDAEQMYQIKIKKQFFHQWHKHILDKQSKDENQAIMFYRKKCLKKFFTQYYDFYQEYLMVLDSCDELYCINLMKLVWRQWYKKHEEIQEIERENQEKLEKIADNYAKKYIPKRFLRKWIIYYRNKKDEQWREYRKELLRGKVKEWLSHSTLNSKKYISTIK